MTTELWIYLGYRSLAMERWRNKVALVTGASAGIGAACARGLVAAGLTVVGLARRHERMLELKHSLPAEQQSRLHAVKCDITKEDNVFAAFKWTESTLGDVHVLINNAGVIPTTELCKEDNTAAIRSAIETNLMGTVFCTREAFKSMKAKNIEGHVILINSVAGHQVPNLGPDLPSLNIYPATKFALRAMNEIYRQEFQRNKTKVRISSISPGIVNTDILPVDIQTVVKKCMPMLSAKDVADAVLWAIGTPPNMQIHNIIIKPLGEKF